MISTVRISTLISFSLLVLPFASVYAAEPLKLDNDTAHINYSLGYQIGGDFKSQGIEMNTEAVVKGIEDALSGAEPLMSPQRMDATLSELKRKVVNDQRTKLRQSGRERELEYLAEGEKFMKENATKPGVKTTASGLQYKIIKPGKGQASQPSDQVTVNYRGNLTNGNEFDSSYERDEPATFKLNGVIKGWTEGLQLIKEGGKIQLFIPPRLAYGKRGPMGHRTLIFDVELIAVAADAQAGSSQEATAEGKGKGK